MVPQAVIHHLYMHKADVEWCDSNLLLVSTTVLDQHTTVHTTNPQHQQQREIPLIFTLWQGVEPVKVNGRSLLNDSEGKDLDFPFLFICERKVRV